jgi:hypothetical protein
MATDLQHEQAMQSPYVMRHHAIRQSAPVCTYAEMLGRIEEEDSFRVPKQGFAGLATGSMPAYLSPLFQTHLFFGITKP